MSPQQQPKHREKLGDMAVSLLNGLLNNSLDLGYAEAAKRRDERSARGKPAPSRIAGLLVLAVGMLLIGVVPGLAYRQTLQQAPESARVKLALIHDIEEKTRTSNDLERQAEDLASQVAAERDAALAASNQGNATQGQLASLESCTGLVPVRGPGMVVTVGDAAPQQQTDPITGQPVELLPDENGRISDRDLQTVVNAIWAAGAEAIAINGRRLTPTSPIREAGGAILVDFFPVTTPYRIEVIGDPDQLPPRFVDSRVGQQFNTYVDAYQIQFTVDRADSLSLPAAAGAELRYAGPLPTPSSVGSPDLAGSSASAGPSDSATGIPTPGGSP